MAARSKFLPGALALLVSLSFVGAASAESHVYTYDPADEITQRLTGSLTFEFSQRLIYTTIHRLRSTQGQASAELKPVSESVLGKGGLDRLIGINAREHDLYEVQSSGEGADLINAFCPGSRHAWLAFGRMSRNEDLKVRVLGDNPTGGSAHLCSTLEFKFRGEWTLPPGPRIRDRPNPRSTLP